MSNTILIKHGTGDPSGKLLPYELGFRDDTGALYINNGTKAVQLTGLATTGLVTNNNYLKLPAITATSTSSDMIMVVGTNNTVYYRTRDNILKDIQALPLAGGTVTGATTFNQTVTVGNTLTANGALIVGPENYGYTNPNDDGKTGKIGQLYFVITG